MGILQFVEGAFAEAAQAACNRAGQCQARVVQLAAGKRIVPADVDRARRLARGQSAR